MVGQRFMWALCIWAAGFVSAVIEYGRKRNRAIASCFRAGAEQYARKHPRSGPKLVAWMDEHWGRACPGK